MTNKLDSPPSPPIPFSPPFCPSASCKNHTIDRIDVPDPSWFSKRGFYTTTNEIAHQRFSCNTCEGSFSQTQFSLSFYQKKHIPTKDLWDLLTHSTSIRGMATIIGCSPTTILRKIALLSRQALAILTLALTQIQIQESFVSDGFESFAYSKYAPHDIHILVGKFSQFCSDFNAAPFKRKGRMTDAQKKRCTFLYKSARFPKGSLTSRFSQIIDTLLTLYAESNTSDPLVLYTDFKKQYVTALERHPGIQELQKKGLFTHIQISSQELRDVRNHLFAVNYLDREFRKDLSEFHRKSTCFARDLGCQMHRVSIYICWHNFIKHYRIKGNDKRSHAEVAGIPSEWVARCRTWIKEDRRFFLSRLPKLPPQWEDIWRDEVITPLKQLSGNPNHGRTLPKYALA